MPAGFITKSLSSLSDTIARWVEYANGQQSPVHGSILLDHQSGTPLEFLSNGRASAQNSIPVTFSLEDFDLLDAKTGSEAKQIQGNISSGALDSGNPIKIAGVYRTNPILLGNGQRTDLQTDSYGSLKTALTTPDGASRVLVSTPSITPSSQFIGLHTISAKTTFNGASYTKSIKPFLTQVYPSSTATINSRIVRNQPTDLFKVTGINTSSRNLFIKLYNKNNVASVETDTPFWIIVAEPSKSFELSFESEPLYFNAGISMIITPDIENNGSTAIEAGDILALSFAIGS